MRRLIALLARFASALMLRRLEVTDVGRLPGTGRSCSWPTTSTGSSTRGDRRRARPAAPLHRQGRACGRCPLAGLLLRGVGVVFVRRRVDKARSPASNDDAFAECHAALAKRDMVAIFPEGTTHDRPQLDPIKTGAARIALGARAAGATAGRSCPSA